MSVYNCGKEELKDKSAAPRVISTEEKCRNTGADLLSGLDRDTVLTAALLLLLIRDGGDRRLILALGYILIGGEK